MLGCKAKACHSCFVYSILSVRSAIRAYIRNFAYLKNLPSYSFYFHLLKL